MFYDSIEIEQIKTNEGSKNHNTPAGAYVRGLQAQAIEDFGDDPDQTYFKPGSLLSLETGLRI